MGVALAAEAAARGAEVTLVGANLAVAVPAGVRAVAVETAAQLRDAVEAEFDATDVLLMAAAVADFRPAGPAADKIKKAGREGLTVELEPTDDVLAGVSARRSPGQTLVGFAAEHGEGGLEHARDKLARKGLDAVVLNDIARARHRLRHRPERGHRDHRLRGARRPDRLQARRGGCHPR